jgi:hypothetical protein
LGSSAWTQNEHRIKESQKGVDQPSQKQAKGIQAQCGQRQLEMHIGVN